MTDALDSPAIRFCWCPPMQDPDDPAQHEASCSHAAFVEQMQQHRGDTAEAVGAVLGAQARTLGTDLLERLGQPNVFRDGLRNTDSPKPSTGCYKASFGWVHVRPGCRCPR